MGNKSRVAIYARIMAQDRFPQNQVLEMRAFAESRGWVVAQEFVDSTSSGGNEPASLEELMLAARARRMDVILVWRFERIASSLQRLVAMLDEFRSLGIAIVSLGDAIDTTTSSGQMMQSLVTTLAKFDAGMCRMEKHCRRPGMSANTKR